MFPCARNRTKAVLRFRYESLEVAEAVRKGIARQFDGGLKLQLPHHASLVELHGFRRDVQHAADLFGRIAGRDQS